MNEVFKKTETDFRGNKLCEHCWNGVHFIHDHLGGLVNNCKGVDKDGVRCECECSAMQSDWSEHNRSIKRVAKELKATQTTIPIVGSIEIKRNS